MMNEPANGAVWSTGMRAVLSAQFFSAFGDNALLFVTLALLKQQAYPLWSQPLLQMLFVAAYILLAPVVGQLADCLAKSRVMMLANSIKLLGSLVILMGSMPFVGYVLVGMGAAAYSPAKYGILSELATGDRLVKANALMEGSTIAAILLGSVSGGWLADGNLSLALTLCAIVYLLAVVANLFIPRLPAVRQDVTWRLLPLIRHFWGANQQLWRDRASCFSLVGTSLFWGAGVTLRFLLVLWVPAALGITDNRTPSVLNALVAIGIVVGAWLAAKWITLKTVYRCLPAGLLIGITVVLLMMQNQLPYTLLLLLLIGISGGFFIVPLNALLQTRGQQSVGSGHAIAVQNLGENSAMLLMLGGYLLAIKRDIPVVITGIGFGVLFTVAIALLWCWLWWQKRSH